MALKDISTELAKQGKTEEAIECALIISSEFIKNMALKEISTELAKQGQIEEAASVMHHACSSYFSVDMRDRLLRNLTRRLAEQGKKEGAHACAHAISDKRFKILAQNDISSQLAKHSKFEESMEFTSGKMDANDKNSINISSSINLIELAKQGKLNEALELARDINNDLDKSRALKDISTELANQGRFEEALECALSIPDDLEKTRPRSRLDDEVIWLTIDAKVKISTLKDISKEMAKQGRLEEALECARSINSDSDKSMALKEISTELYKLVKVEESASVMNEALECARGIINDSDKSDALKDISTELAKQGNWSKAEQTGLEIPQIANRYTCWQTISRDACKNQGWQKALSQAHQFRNPESCRYYLKHLAQMVNLADCHANLLLNALPNYQEDVESIETILYMHALHELFFEEASTVKINRFNRTLNLQWAIDIKNSISHN